MLIVDGKVVAEKNDADTTAALNAITTVLGNTTDNVNALKALVTDGTVITAIRDLYDMLGGISFSVNPTNNCLVATYDDGT